MLLFQVRSSDPIIVVFVSGLLILVSLVATAIPAIQATRIDPIKTLRQE